MSVCRTNRILCWISLWACIAGFGAAPSPRNGSLEKLQKAYADRQLQFVADIERLIVECQEKQLDDAAENLRTLKTIPEWNSLHLEALPKSVQTSIPNDLPEAERSWRTRLRELQSDHARSLYQLAQQVLRAGYPSFAYNLVRETAVHDPDHALARKFLGYVRVRDEWMTPFAAKMLREQHIWTDQFGWIRKADEERYEKGERYIHQQKKWVSEAKERELRQDFNLGWEIRTDHFLIKTNHSREEALRLGQALEEFYEVFFQTFAGFFTTQEQLRKLFNGAGPEAKAAVKPYVVHYYRTRQEYIDLLKPQFPQIEVTNGIYLTADRRAYFYHDPEANNEATLFHEATHQLFYESHDRPRAIGEKAHFWIIEGIACYMESFRRGNQGMSLGDPNYIRFAGARHNLLKEEYYVPLGEFAAMGMNEFQRDPMLVKNYTQASGLAQFFMHYDNGRYREALVAHLSQLYSRDDRKRNLAQGLDVLTDVPADELDREYAEFCRQLDAGQPVQAEDAPVEP